VQIDYRWGAGDRGQLLPSRQRDDQVTMNSRRRGPVSVPKRPAPSLTN
jgi:hypothetical protein